MTHDVQGPITQGDSITQQRLIQREAKAKEAQQKVVGEALELIKKDYPKWFEMSDTLGERPIDGWLRRIDKHKLDMLIEESVNKREQAVPKYGVGKPGTM